MVDLNEVFLSVGGSTITGFQDEAIDIAEPSDKVQSLKGLDAVVWVRSHKKSQELIVTVKLLPNSASVKTLRRFEDTGEVVPFVLSWDSIGVEIMALEAIVIETEGLGISASPDGFTFEIRVKNFTSFKGI